MLMAGKKENSEKSKQTAVDLAVACFQEGFSCSQAVLSACSERFGLDRETALRVAGAFGGGMARRGETCGAVTGAFMVIGLKHGKIKAEDNAAREKTYELAKEFTVRFTSKNKTIICKELLGYDLSTPEGREAVKEKKLATTICPKFVQDAVEIVEEIVKE
jgi:C_GCAxxG_C_C family probable redox protein